MEVCHCKKVRGRFLTRVLFPSNSWLFFFNTKMMNFNNTTNATVPSSPPSVALSTAQNSSGWTHFVLPQYAKMIFYVVQCVLVVLGLVGNVLVVLSVRTNSQLKKSISNLFIMNLAIADIAILLVSHTFILGLEIGEFHWPFGEFSCRALFPLSDAFFGVSIWSIVAISFHRYRGIVHTMNVQLSAKKARFILVLTWMASVVLITLPLWVYMKLHRVGRTDTCLTNWPNRESFTAYNISLNTFFYFLPLALILYFYYHIRVSLKQSSGFHRRMTKTSSQSALRDDVAKRIGRNAKALRVLTPVVIVFFVTMLPFTIFRLLLAFAFAEMSSFPYTRITFFSCNIMVLANSSANPVIYTIVSPEFRRSFMRFLGMKRFTKDGNFSKCRKKYSMTGSECLSPIQDNPLKPTHQEDSLNKEEVTIMTI